jgi:ABC-2 type transport system permease protein
MMDKFMYLLEYSLKKKIMTKAFVISNIIIGALIIGLVNIDSIISYFGGDFSSTSNIYIQDFVGLDDVDQAEFLEKLSSDNEDDVFEVTYTDQEVDSIIEEDEDAIIVELTLDQYDLIKGNIISKEYISTSEYTSLTATVNYLRQKNGFELYDIDQEVLAKINFEPIERTILDEEKTEMEEQVNIILGPIVLFVIMPMFFAIILVVQMIGMEIFEEKSSRSMEIVMSNIKAGHHFLAKLLSINIFMIIQFIMFLIFGAIGFQVRGLLNAPEISINPTDVDSLPVGELGGMMRAIIDSGLFERLPVLILFTLLFLVVGYTLYGTVVGVLASLTTNMEDYQKIQGPVMIMLLISFYSAMANTIFQGSYFLIALAYFPFFSPILAPVLYASSAISLLELTIIFGISCLTLWFVIHFGIQIYRVAILDYSQKDVMKRLLKNIRHRKAV